MGNDFFLKLNGSQPVLIAFRILEIWQIAIAK
jgi:hypothetical protein